MPYADYTKEQTGVQMKIAERATTIANPIRVAPPSPPTSGPEPSDSYRPLRDRPSGKTISIPLFPILGAVAGATAGALGFSSPVAAAAGAAIGGIAGFIIDKSARMLTPEGPRLIVGHTEPTSAKVWGRGDGRHPHMFVEIRDKDDQVVQTNHIELSKEHGYTGVANMTGLQPGQDYQCQVSYSMTADGPKSERAYQQEGQLHTPNPEDKDTTFFLGSCNNHRFWRREESWQRIGKAAESIQPDFMLHTGDQIYADQPLQSYQAEGIRGCYRRAWSSDDAQDMLRNRANYMILDDHEVGNGFGQDTKIKKFRQGFMHLKGLWGNNSGLRKTLQTEGLAAYRDYQHSHNPHTFGEDKLYYTFSRGQNQFFVMDARTERDPDSGRLISDDQMQQLKDWMTSHPNQPKFIVSSVPFLAEAKERGEDEIWTSTAYRNQRNEILEFIAQQDLKGVCLLTGDSHTTFHASTELHGPDGHDITVHELSASPINGFWVHGANMWEDQHREVTKGGLDYQTTFDTRNFLASKHDLSRDASGFMSVHCDGENVDYQILRTHRDDPAPFRNASFSLNLSN